jgi:hypothetical protein
LGERGEKKLGYFRRNATLARRPSTSGKTSSRKQRDISSTSTKMANTQEAWRQLQRMALKARAGGGGGGGGGGTPRGLGAGIGGLLLLGGAAVVGNNALFNVDGGHRAIKYTRAGGVGKEIYSEGMSCPLDAPLS